MGVVYKARRPGLDRFVALKVLLHSETASATRVKRFQREAELAAKLRHEGIVQVYDFGQVGDHYYLTMDFVEGRALSDVVNERPLSVTRAAEIGKEAAEALAHAHDAGVIHRDIKPANIMLTPEGRPVLTDFGLARQAELEGETTQLTRDGALVGTPFFMSPEQASGKRERVVPKSDVWSLGVVIYQMACGALPFDGTSQFELSNKVLHEEPTPPRDHRSDLDEDMVTILLKTLEKDPDQRYSARELADELTRYLAGEALVARPRTTLETLRRKLQGRRPLAYALFGVVLVAELGLWGAIHTKLEIDRSSAAAALEVRLGELREAAEKARRDREERLRADEAAIRDAVARVERLEQEANQSSPGAPYQEALRAVLAAIDAALELEPLRDSARLHVQRGRALARRLPAAGARAALLRAVELDPTGPHGAEATYHLAALEDRSQTGNARTLLGARLAKLDPQLAGVWVPLFQASMEVLEDDPDLEKAKRLLERARDLDSRRPQIFLLLALIARSRGNAEGALKAIERSTQLDPKSASAWTEYARLVASKDPRRGSELIDRAVKLDPSFPPAVELKVIFLEAEGKPKEALAVLKRLLTGELGKDPDLVFKAALLAQDADEAAQASELLHTLEGLEPNSHRSYLARAVELFRANEHEPGLLELRRGAEALAQRLPAAAKSESFLRRFFKTYAQRLGRHDLLKNYAESLRRAGDLNGEVLLASMQMRKGKLELSRAAVDKILERSPHHPEALRLHFELLGRGDDTKTVRAEVERLLQEASDKLETLLIAARATVALLEDPKATARVTARLEELDAKDSRVVAYRAQIHLSEGEFSEAATLLVGLLREDPTTVEAPMIMASLYLTQDEPAQALPFLTATHRFDPFDESVNQNLALVLFRARPSEALKITSAYIEFYDSAKVTPSPRLVRTHVSILLKLRRPEVGIKLARELFERYQSYEYLLSEAECLMAIGEVKRARRVLDEIKKLAPDSPGLRKLEQAFEGLGQ
jgi:cytochrome c-type biogenesis protein CcmH/NrfG/predicted Ser/Thr protein kinase